MIRNICIGTAQFGMKYGISNTTGQVKYDEILSIIDRASNNGIRFYDTAKSYGSSETIIGQAFTELGICDIVKCITKIDPDVKDLDELVQQVLESLENMNIKQLWGLLTHRAYQSQEPFVLEAISVLKDKQIIKHFGVSIYDPNDALEAVNNNNVDIIQVPFNILDRRLIDNGFFDLAHKKGKKVFMRSIFLQGLLLLSDQQLIEKNFGWVLPYLNDYKKRFHHIGLDCTINQFAIQAVLQKFPGYHIIIGVESTKQLKMNIEAINLTPDKEKAMSWWTNLPLYPDRLLNPTLW